MSLPDETDGAASGSEPEASGQEDRNHMVVDTVTSEAFLAALKKATPPRQRRLDVVRATRPEKE